MKIIISRTDNLGDVMLTLPMAGALKKRFPDVEIIFIGKAYTKALVAHCAFIDAFLDREDVIEDLNLLKQIKADAIVHVYPDKEIAKAAKKAGIPLRIGTSHRVFHWFNCNKLVNLSRKNAQLHETQLNIKLLAPLGIKEDYTLHEIAHLYGFSTLLTPEKNSNTKFKVIIHPKSKGSAREWKLKNYFDLIQSLPKDIFEIFITGTKEEGDKIKTEMPNFFSDTLATDVTGKINLDELIEFIGSADALVACSTGPLHIAAALGKVAIGLYPPMKPLHPGRWRPIGKKAKVFCLEKKCDDCRKSSYCYCINAITPDEVAHCLKHANLTATSSQVL